MSTPTEKSDQHESSHDQFSQTDVDVPDKDATADELESDIERTREQLGETVDALTQKLDFKSRGREKVTEVKHSARAGLDAARTQGTAWLNQTNGAVRDDDGQVKMVVPLGAAALVVAVGLYVVWKTRR